METVRILDIQRMSSEDGPGLRTTVFFKGCPLACAWCHNPESIVFRPQVLWHNTRCMGCGSCPGACPNACITLNDGGVSRNRDDCAGCFACCDICPTGALEAKGTEWELSELCRELVKDKAYFGLDGGVTLSGGEALAQAGSVGLLKLIKEAGVKTALDTCGLVAPDRLKSALEVCDIVLFDMKIADSELHFRHTGAGNEQILDNLRLVSEWAEKGGRLWIRTPIIPGFTDSIENIKAIGEIIKGVPAIERWELCAFNNLCLNKYKSLGLQWPFEGQGLIEKTAMALLLDAARGTAACGDIRATGALA